MKKDGANFNKYTDYDPNSSVSSVIFGEKTPLLETALNEVQEILKKSQKLLILGLFGEGAVLNKFNFAFNAPLLNINNTVMAVKGSLILLDEVSVAYENNTNIYVGVKEVEADYKTEIRKNGYLKGEIISNYFVDKRFGYETTKRKTLVYDLFSETTDTTSDYLKIGSTLNNNFISCVNEVSLTTNSNVEGGTELPDDFTSWKNIVTAQLIEYAGRILELEKRTSVYFIGANDDYEEAVSKLSDGSLIFREI